MTDDNPQRQGNLYKRIDADFKKAVHNTDILSVIASRLIPELKGRDLDFVKRCVSPDGARRLPGLNTEMHNDDDYYVIMDNLFSIIIPGEREIGLMLNIEGQGDPDPGYPILKRGLYYASGIIFNQKGTVFPGTHYENLRKTYSIWFVLQPKSGDENTIVRYPLMKVLGADDARSTNEDANLLEIIIVNLGRADSETVDETMTVFNEIFAAKDRGDVYKKRLADKYKITIDDDTLRSLEDIGMSLGDEIRDYQIRTGYKDGFSKGYDEGFDKGLDEGYNEGLDEGRNEGLKEGRNKGLEEGLKEGHNKGLEEGLKEGRSEIQTSWIENLVKTVLGLMSRLDISLEDAIDLANVPGDFRIQVSEKVREELEG